MSTRKIVQPIEIKEKPEDLLMLASAENIQLKSALDKSKDELRLLKAQLFHADKLATLGTIGASVAHELNNPLTIISAEADEILEVIQTSENLVEIGEYAKIIKKNVRRMASLISRMCQHSRNDVEMAWRKLDFVDIINDAIFLLRPQLKSLNIRLKLNIVQQAKIWGNRDKLESVVQNLVANARDAFEEIHDNREKVITISVIIIQSNVVVLEISDNALGVPKGMQTRIFEPFVTTKNVNKGTGLGLAIVSDIVQEHGGKINMQSEPGAGAKFILQFPLERRKVETG